MKAPIFYFQYPLGGVSRGQMQDVSGIRIRSDQDRIELWSVHTSTEAGYLPWNSNLMPTTGDGHAHRKDYHGALQGYYQHSGKKDRTTDSEEKGHERGEATPCHTSSSGQKKSKEQGRTSPTGNRNCGTSTKSKERKDCVLLNRWLRLIW